MNLYRDINNLPTFKNAVITTGSFDGVHTGHLLILRQLMSEAKERNGTAVVITFYPHPKQVVGMDKKTLYVLNTPAEKFALLQQKGIQHIVVVPFDKAFAQLSGADYIERFLADKFHPKAIVTGYDHRFGNNREGDFPLLQKAGEKFGFEVKEIPEHVMQNVIISSTKIREALLSGDIRTAATYLGYDYFFTGKVTEGNKLGRTIGYPTANLLIEDEHKLVPANGVYAVELELNGRKLKGMMNIGLRPTVGGSKRSIEVNIFDLNENLYGENIKVTFKYFLRSEIKFSGLDALKTQLAADELRARGMLK